MQYWKYIIEKYSNYVSQGLIKAPKKTNLNKNDFNKIEKEVQKIEQKMNKEFL